MSDALSTQPDEDLIAGLVSKCITTPEDGGRSWLSHLGYILSIVTQAPGAGLTERELDTLRHYKLIDASLPNFATKLGQEVFKLARIKLALLNMREG